MAKKKNPFKDLVGSGMAKTGKNIKPGKAKGMPLKVKGEKEPAMGIATGGATPTAKGATFGAKGSQKRVKKVKKLKK